MSSPSSTTAQRHIMILPPSPIQERPKTASPHRFQAGTPSPVNIPVDIQPSSYSFIFPCKTCAVSHTVTYAKKDGSLNEYKVGSSQECYKAYELGKSILKIIMKNS